MSKANCFDISTMGKIITLLLMLTINYSVAQPLTGPATVNNYSIAQKRLLVTSIFQYATFLTQNNCDEDSLMNMAGKIAGMPFLLPYQEGFASNDTTIVTSLINRGFIDVAKLAVEHAIGERRIKELLEISIWYLHQDGTHRNDLDSASRFLQFALKESIATGSMHWKNECIFQSAELQLQQGDILQSMATYNQLAAAGLQTGKIEMAARAFMRMGDLHSQIDSSREEFYRKSLEIYEELSFSEKQIELLWRVAFCHERDTLFSLAEKDLRKVISIANSIGFKHNLFAQIHLSYILVNLRNYLGSMDYARAGLENMQWSGLSEVQGTFYIRLGAAYAVLGKLEESVQWIKKAMSTGTKANHLFWYRSIFFLTGVLGFESNKPAIALSLIDSVIRIFPPITVWEKLEVSSSLGVCNQLLGKSQLADRYYCQLLQMAKKNPLADPYGEISGDYLFIAEFYVSQNKLAMARLFLDQSVLNAKNRSVTLEYRYSIYYKIDSLEGNYKSALQNHIQYKSYYDANINTDQRKKMDELEVKFATEKKDKDINLLKQQHVVQQSEIKKNKLVRDIMIAGTAMLIIIVALLFNRYKLKKRANSVINLKNMALQRVVNEKEWLLKEVHHRVKNNLHTIISLLESQAAYLENDALKAIENSQHRIYAMSLIHQKLYQAENVKTIDMSVYLPEFIRYLDESFEMLYRSQFILDIEVINLGVSQAIPVALIINEAVTNSIKYAFPNKSNGVIRIIMYKEANQVSLIVADNGIGVDEELLNMPSETLGLKLMQGLSEDINASFAIEIDKGTKITLVFDVDRFAANDVLPDVLNHTQQYV